MRKAISLLAALATICSVSVVAFAAEDDVATPYAGDNAVTPSTRAAIGESGNIVVGANELFLVDEGGKVISGVDNKLNPNTDYTFEIYYNSSGGELNGNDSAVINSGTRLTGAMLNGATLRLRTIRGSSYVQSARIRTIGRGASARYELRITTREYLGTKLNELEYSLSATGGSPTVTINESTHTFEVGYETIPDEDTNVGEGGTILISNDYPVILKDQFTDIAKSANYKNVIFESEDGNWTFTGKVSGMKDTNFVYTYDPVIDLLNKFPDQDFKFLTFKAGVNFPTNGEMRIDVSDISDNFNNMYAYLYRNGKLTSINGTYDSGANELVFRTNYLGAFVITNRAITDTTIIGDTDDDDTDVEPPATDDDDDTNNNPTTGAAPVAGLVALGVATLASAGAIRRRK